MRPIRSPRVRPGAAPGTLIAHPDAHKPRLYVIAYGPDGQEESELDSPAELRSYLERWPVTWINVDGLGDAETIRELGEIFDIHSLVLEDVLNVEQRSKLEEHDEDLYIVARMPEQGETLETEQLSLFLGKNYVVTFQEHQGDCLEAVRERIRRGRGRARRMGADYLAYALLDVVVDSYFPVLERYSESLSELEERILTDDQASSALNHRLHRMRLDLQLIRRIISAKRDVFNSLIRDELPAIRPETRVFLRDCYDHSIQLLDLSEMQRETAANLRDLSMTLMSHRMNEIMKVLTIIATIFIPLTFIAGIYGMNFDAEKSAWNMPELGWAFGYPLCLAVMVLVTLGLVVYFRRRGWL